MPSSEHSPRLYLLVERIVGVHRHIVAGAPDEIDKKASHVADAAEGRVAEIVDAFQLEVLTTNGEGC